MADECKCESSYCDHMKSTKPKPGFPWGVPGQCKRPPDNRFAVAYVGMMCTQCVVTMCVSGGEKYIKLVRF